MKICYTRHINMLKFMDTGFIFFLTHVDYRFLPIILKFFTYCGCNFSFKRPNSFSWLFPQCSSHQFLDVPGSFLSQDLCASPLLMLETLDQDKLPSFHLINSTFRSQVKNHFLPKPVLLQVQVTVFYYRLGSVFHPLLTFALIYNNIFIYFIFLQLN